MWIDFVNLRCEEYSDDSRIPKTVLEKCNFIYEFVFI